jgi:hypothetical protein
VKLGTENKKQTTWAIVLGVIAVLLVAYEVIPMFSGPSAASSAPSAPAVVPTIATRPTPKSGSKSGKKTRAESLDPTLRLELLASSEDIKYSGLGRNIFVSQAEAPPTPIGNGTTDHAKKDAVTYTPPPIPQAPPIPLKFFGFASQPGEPKKIFLSQGEDVFIAGEGEIIDRRYKIIRISPTSVEMQDVVNSGPSQNIPLTQG